MLDKMLDNPWLWDLSRYFLDLTCGLYRKRTAFLNGLGLFKDNPSVLDIGCGTGLFAEITQGYYVGIDSNCRNIERAEEKRYKEEKIFRCADLSVLRKEKAMFDVILIVDVIHHLNDRECVDLLRTSAEMTRKHLINFDVILKKDMTSVEKWFLRHDKGGNFRCLEDFNKLFQASGYKIMENRDMRLGYLSTHLTICCLGKV